MKVGVYLQQYLTYNLQVTYLDSETDTNVIKIGIMISQSKNSKHNGNNKTNRTQKNRC